MELNQQPQSTPQKKLPTWLTTVTPFSKTLAMILFILLPFLGFYLGMKYQQQVTIPSSTVSEVQKVPSLTPTPRSTLQVSSASAGWLTFTSPRGDYSINFPSNWTYSGPVAPIDNTDIYINMPLKQGYNEGGPYVWISKVTNKNNADFLTFITGGNQNIEKNVKITDNKIGIYNVKEVTGLPSKMASINVYFPLENNNYIDVAFTPYAIGVNNQAFSTFQNILSSFKLLK